MSLENAIQENTKALLSLAEIIKQALSMKPVQAPVAAAAPIQPVAAPAPEAKAAPVEPVAVADLPPVAAPAPAPKAEPKAAPAPAIDPVELREAMVSKLQKLFEHSPAKGAEILRSFGVRRQSELPDEKLPSFCDALVKALEAEGVL